MIVMVLIGAGMTTMYQLLQAVWAESFSGGTSLQIKQFFKFGRERALQEGSIITMVIDFEKKTTGLRLYNPSLEDFQDTAVNSLLQKKASQSSRISQFLDNIKKREEEFNEEKQLSEEKEDWILNPTPLPTDLEKIYSIGGVELTGPKIFVHFYPNSTSDSLIFKFKQNKRQYLYLPRYNIPAVYLDNLETLDNYFDNLDK